jgi:chemotaxis protein CheX
MHDSDMPETLLLPPVLDLTRAESLHGDLQAWMARDAAVRVDGRAVERVSTACLQVMAAAAVTAHAHGRSFKMLTPSETLLNALRDLGLSNLLMPEAP